MPNTNYAALLSVVTVCKNGESQITETIESVLSQDFSDYEYLIIDGASTDRTMEIVERYRAAFRQKGIDYSVLSEKDSGIYNAMNKAIDLCAGEWVIFMNAGDTFYNCETMSRAASFCGENADLVFGDTVFRSGNYYKYESYSSYPPEMPFCHQSAFTRSSFLKQFHFDESYRIAADYQFYIRMSRLSPRICKLTFPISIFSEGGLSSKNWYSTEREKACIRFRESVYSEEEYRAEIALLDGREARELASEQAHTLRNTIKHLIPDCIMIPLKRRKYGWSRRCP